MSHFLKIFVFTVLLNYSYSAYGQGFREEYLIENFITKLYDFSFNEADSLLAIISASQIDKATVNNMKANHSWWKLLSGDSVESNITSCDYYLDQSLGSVQEKKEINSIFNIIYAYSLKARLENYRGNTLRSLILFHKSISYIEKSDLQPEKEEKIKLILGLYNYFTDYFRDEYLLMGALFMPFQNVNKIKGLLYLEECTQSDDILVKTEANYFLMKIYAGTEKNYTRALEKAFVLTSYHPGNLVFDLERLKILLLLKEKEEAQMLYEKLLQEINVAVSINQSQKDHFITQLRNIWKN